MSEETGRPHFFTVDVEEYFQVSLFESLVPRGEWDSMASRVDASVDRLLERMDAHGAYGTFFTLGWIADRHPDLIRRIAAAGHEIASHGWWHRRVTGLSREELTVELGDSRAILEDVSGTPVRGFRAPSFSIVPGVEWAFDVLLEQGYTYDSSIFPIRRAGYGYPGADPYMHTIQRDAGELLELPLATTEVGNVRVPAAGGAYLRLLPQSLTCRALREHAARGESAVFYVHPWEIDADQPRLPVSWPSRVRHYHGLDRMLDRIERLLREFRFTSIERGLGLTRRSSADPARSVGS